MDSKTTPRLMDVLKQTDKSSFKQQVITDCQTLEDAEAVIRKMKSLCAIVKCQWWKLTQEKDARKYGPMLDTIDVGGRYFYSYFWDEEGSWITVIEKSSDVNHPMVKCLVVETLPTLHYEQYPIGKIFECHVANLFKQREEASHAFRTKNL